MSRRRLGLVGGRGHDRPFQTTALATIFLTTQTTVDAHTQDPSPLPQALYRSAYAPRSPDHAQQKGTGASPTPANRPPYRPPSRERKVWELIIGRTVMIDGWSSSASSV